MKIIWILVCKINILAGDPSPLIEGVKINSPHYLTKIKFNETPEKDFTLVVGQYEKTTTIYYTLRAYSDSPFELTKIGNPYNYVKKVNIIHYI